MKFDNSREFTATLETAISPDNIAILYPREEDKEKLTFTITAITEKPTGGEEMKNDNVNRPKHYTHGGIETIDNMVMIYGPETVNQYCELNAYKYLSRHKAKNGKEDILKAKWYLNYRKAHSYDYILNPGTWYTCLIDILNKAIEEYDWTDEEWSALKEEPECMKPDDIDRSYHKPSRSGRVSYASRRYGGED